MKFEVGDKVRLTDTGQVGDVKRCDKRAYQVDWSEGHGSWWVCEEAIELVNPTFCVGDTVKVRCLYSDEDTTKTGVVFIEDQSHRLAIRYDSGGWDFIGGGSTEVIEVLASAPYVEATKPVESGVTRIIGADVAGLVFNRRGDVVTISCDDAQFVAQMSIDQFREVVKIIDGEAK